MDYYGTVTFENGPISMEVVKRVYKSSSADSPEEVFRCWWKKYKQKLEEYNGENFRTQHDVALDCFKELLEEFSSGENPDELLARMEEHWCTTPVYEDAAKFLQEVSLPVYFVTNSDDRYVYESIKKYDQRKEKHKLPHNRYDNGFYRFSKGVKSHLTGNLDSEKEHRSHIDAQSCFCKFH